MLLVSSCVSVITLLCNHVMRFQSTPTNWPLLTIESPVVHWLEHPTRSQRVVGSNPMWDSNFFRVLLTLISCCFFIFNIKKFSLFLKLCLLHFFTVPTPLSHKSNICICCTCFTCTLSPAGT